MSQADRVFGRHSPNQFFIYAISLRGRSDPVTHVNPIVADGELLQHMNKQVVGSD